MLARRRRLPRAAFPDTQSGVRLSSAHFSLTYKKTPATRGLAVVITKKTTPLSVKRHLLKRRMLAVMELWNEKNLSCIAYARAGADKLPFSLVAAELSDLHKRISRS